MTPAEVTNLWRETAPIVEGDSNLPPRPPAQREEVGTIAPPPYYHKNNEPPPLQMNHQMLSVNPYTSACNLNPRHVEFRITEPLRRSDLDHASAWIYAIIYYTYFISINLIHLAVVIASILVAAEVFNSTVDKWITIGISVATAINLCLTDLMNGYEIQPKKQAFKGLIYVPPKWANLW